MRWITAFLLFSGCTGDTNAQRPGKRPADLSVDLDEDGFDTSMDCDDDDPEINPDQPERCDGLDNDCDGTIDLGADDAGVWYVDLDGDGFGDPASPTTACNAPTDQVADASDCDDNDPFIYPTSEELCDGVDNNCDGTIDTNATDRINFYADSDDDGYGDSAVSQKSCEAPPGYVLDDQDCDDDDPSASPETVWYGDHDYDGYGDPNDLTTSCDKPWDYVANPDDCDDGDYAVRPGALEICDGQDNDCDLDVDGGPDACSALAGSYAGTYRLLTQEKVGTIVVNSMDCAEPSTLTITIDPTAAPVVTGEATCHYSGGLSGFDDDQSAVFALTVTPDGSLSGTIEQEFSTFSFPDGTFSITGTVGLGLLSLSGEGLYWPSSFSAVGWETTITVEGARP